MKYVIKFALLLFVLIFLNACAEKVENPDLAQFTGGKIVQNEYIEYYLFSTLYKPEVMPTEDNLREIILLKAMEKMTVLEAQQTRIDTQMAYIQSCDHNEGQILYEQYMRQEMIDRVITDSLIRKFYDALSPQYRMRYIMMPFVNTFSKKFIRSQKDSIDFVYQLLQSGADFEEVAKKHSQETSTKEKGGDLGFVIRESLGDKQLRTVMDTLKQFAFSKPFRGYSGYYILYKGEKREVSVPPLEETRGKIWETLFRTRRHNIKERAEQRFTELAPKYHYQVDDQGINKIKVKAGGTRSGPDTQTLNFEQLTDEDLSIDVATYQGGSIKASEFFLNPKKAPINMYEFKDDLASVSPSHIFALEAKKIGIDKNPEIMGKIEKMQESIIRNLFYQVKVRDKAQMMADSVKSEAVKNNILYTKSDMQKKYYTFETELKTDLEQKIKEKYNFKFMTSKFAQALEEASRRKEIQNEEREKRQ
jgi:hypothetical protein